jgi:hypothetical protein
MADLLSGIIPYLGATGAALVNLDAARTGADDFGGEVLMHVADVIAAVSAGEDIPPFPEAIKAGTTDKISGASRAVLMVASAVLMIAQFQVTGKARMVLRYASQAIQLLLAGAPVPAAPKL